MRIQISEPVDVIRWAYRLLYVQLFISLMVVMGYWGEIMTYTFLGSVLALLLPVLFSRKEMFDVSEKVLLNEQ